MTRKGFHCCATCPKNHSLFLSNREKLKCSALCGFSGGQINFVHSFTAQFPSMKYNCPNNHTTILFFRQSSAFFSHLIFQLLIVLMQLQAPNHKICFLLRTKTSVGSYCLWLTTFRAYGMDHPPRSTQPSEKSTCQHDHKTSTQENKNLENP